MAPGESPKETPLLVESQAAFSDVAKRLRTASRLAVDTEAASYHRYHDRVYLLQVSSDDMTAVIDPLAVPDLTALGRLLATPRIEIVFHDSDYDLRVLDRDYGFRSANLFDTRLAAQLLGEPGVGLGALLESHFGLTVDKRMQRADWSRRPLTPEMLAYAASDTRHLLALRDRLAEKLVAMNRMHWADEEFKRLESVRWAPPDTDGYLKLKGAKALPLRALSVLKNVWEWRESTAAELDRAPFRVLGNEALMALAKARPSGRRSLSSVQGLPASAVRRFGEGLIQAVRKGLDASLDELPELNKGTRPRTGRAAETRLTRLKTVRNERAKTLGLEPGVLCPNGTLLAIAKSAPEDESQLAKIGELRNWQREAVGDTTFLAAVAGTT